MREWKTPLPSLSKDIFSLRVKSSGISAWGYRSWIGSLLGTFVWSDFVNIHLAAAHYAQTSLSQRYDESEPS